MTNELIALAERCEAATGPDRGLDAEIWLASAPGVSRKETRYTHKASGKECVIDETREASGRLIVVPAYTASLDAAMTLVPEGFAFGCGRGTEEPDVEGWAWCGPDEGPYSFTKTSALALTAAALRARAAQQERKA